MKKWATIIVYKDEDMPIPEMDKKIGKMLLVDKKLPEKIIDYKVLESEEKESEMSDKEPVLKYTMKDAKKTIESSIISALSKTSPITHITIDKPSELIRSIIEEIFHPSVRWAVIRYLVGLEATEKK